MTSLIISHGACLHQTIICDQRAFILLPEPTLLRCSNRVEFFKLERTIIWSVCLGKHALDWFGGLIELDSLEVGDCLLYRYLSFGLHRIMHLLLNVSLLLVYEGCHLGR